MLGLSASIVTSIHLKMTLNREKDVSKGILFNPVKQFLLCGQQPCKFTATKENISLEQKISTLRGLVCDTYMVTVLMFWDTKMVVITLCEVICSNNIIYYIKVSGIPSGNKFIKTIRYPHM